MNPDQTAHVRAHVAAVSKLLLGNKIMNPGLMILAGDPLNHGQQIAFGRTAVEAQVDLVYLEFAIGEDDVPVMTGITVMLPRDTICYVSTGCRLSLVPGKARAVIVPQDGGSIPLQGTAGRDRAGAGSTGVAGGRMRSCRHEVGDARSRWRRRRRTGCAP
ncbi:MULTISPECIES: hypothetical protein [unclassified Sphingomonas]|uniref:hypothetical protein n=1 Tax=unclassified Sphingomonas TaxID=196159 RepID=UPI0028638EE7|nr:MULTISPECIES: hypothetical protein [unclassified Sphingomonas]MDR6116037.1 hypothetical protein [Sphingomonas sp. SORGH_AS_0789]MDR6150290.1 hypothetical protein [Sphingomonas sp. SORGH_AS_0742]